MPDQPSALTGQFRKPFAEQIAFFRGKLGNLVPTQRWDDLDRADHDTAFMVAGAQKADLLTDLAAAVDRSIAEGKSLEAFRQDFRSIVEKRGWHGWTGEGSIGGEAWRTRTIYRTNARTSYAAGRFAQLQSGNFAFWIYRHGAAQEPRLLHLSWDGLPLPPDHEFWIIYYPPSDWGCTCYVIGARNARAVLRLGGDMNKTLPADWNKVDPKTGRPDGVGKGWDYAPGASVAPIVQASAEKIRNWDYRIAKAFMDDVPDAMADALAASYRTLPSVADDARRAAQRVWDGAPDPEKGRTLGLLTSDQAAAIATERQLDAARFDFSLSPDELRHVMAHHGEAGTELARGQRAIAPVDFAQLPGILSGGTLPRFVGMSRNRNQPVFEITRSIDGEDFVTRWEYWRKRRTMTLLNFFVRTGERT